jgi:predicted nucleotidyltransferase
MAPKTDTRLAEFRAKFLPKLLVSFHPQLVIAFGSRARGEALRHSDLDLLVVSETFNGVRWLERPVRVLEALDLPFGADLLCYTPEEYQRKRQELGIVSKAAQEGIVLFTSSRSDD